MVRVKGTPRRSLRLAVQNWAYHTIASRTKHLNPIASKTAPKISPSEGLKKLKFDPGTNNGKKGLQHPLVVHPELPKLTEMQQLITQAILTHGEPCPFDKIYEYVNEKWKDMKIKRRDGAPYSTDCRRAIQANLRQTPNHMPLFAKDSDHAAHWRLVYTLDTTAPFPASTASSVDAAMSDEPSTESSPPSNSRSKTGHGNSSSAASAKSNVSTSAPAQMPRRAQDKTAARAQKQNSTQSPVPVKRERSVGNAKNSANGPNVNTNAANNNRRIGGTRGSRERTLRSTLNSRQAGILGKHVLGNSELSHIQILISCSIEASGADRRATVNQLCTYANKLYSDLRGYNGVILFENLDLRTAIIACLNPSSELHAPIFMRDPSFYTHWKFTRQHPWNTVALKDKQAKVQQLHAYIASTASPPVSTSKGSTNSGENATATQTSTLTATPTVTPTATTTTTATTITTTTTPATTTTSSTTTLSPSLTATTTTSVSAVPSVTATSSPPRFSTIPTAVTLTPPKSPQPQSQPHTQIHAQALPSSPVQISATAPVAVQTQATLQPLSLPSTSSHSHPHQHHNHHVTPQGMQTTTNSTVPPNTPSTISNTSVMATPPPSALASSISTLPVRSPLSPPFVTASRTAASTSTPFMGGHHHHGSGGSGPSRPSSGITSRTGPPTPHSAPGVTPIVSAAPLRPIGASIPLLPPPAVPTVPLGVGTPSNVSVGGPPLTHAFLGMSAITANGLSDVPTLRPKLSDH